MRKTPKKPIDMFISIWEAPAEELRQSYREYKAKQRKKENGIK